MISIPAICLILGIIALLLAISGRLTAAVILAVLALVLFLVTSAGYA